MGDGDDLNDILNQVGNAVSSTSGNLLGSLPPRDHDDDDLDGLLNDPTGQQQVSGWIPTVQNGPSSGLPSVPQKEEEKPEEPVAATSSGSNGTSVIHNNKGGGDGPQVVMDAKQEPNSHHADTTADATHEEIAVVEEVEPPVLAHFTPEEVVQKLRETIISSLTCSEEDKNGYIALVWKKLEEIDDVDPEYKSRDTFLRMTSETIINLLDHKDDFSRINEIYDYAEELTDDLVKMKNRQAWKQELRALSDDFLAKKAVDPKTPKPDALRDFHKKDAKTRAKIKNTYKKILKLQKQLDKLNSKEMSVEDMDDDESPFLLASSLSKRIVRLQKSVRELEMRRPVTGLQIEKKFVFKGSGFDDVDSTVTQFVQQYLLKKDNRNPRFSLPDFQEIRDIVSKCSSVSAMEESEVMNISQTIFKVICSDVRKRREYDNADSLLAIERDYEEFAVQEMDADLAAKLKENDTKKKDETAILEEFRKKQENLSTEDLEKEMAAEVSSSQSGEEDEDSEDSEDEDGEVSDVSDDDDDDVDVPVNPGAGIDDGPIDAGIVNDGDDDGEEGDVEVLEPNVAPTAAVPSTSNGFSGDLGSKKHPRNSESEEHGNDDGNNGEMENPAKRQKLLMESNDQYDDLEDTGEPECIDLCDSD